MFNQLKLKLNQKPITCHKKKMCSKAFDRFFTMHPFENFQNVKGLYEKTPQTCHTNMYLV